MKNISENTPVGTKVYVADGDKIIKGKIQKWLSDIHVCVTCKNVTKYYLRKFIFLTKKEAVVFKIRQLKKYIKVYEKKINNWNKEIEGLIK